MPIINGLFHSGGGEPTTGLASDLLSGKTLNNEDGDNVVGTMPNNGAVGGTITQQAGKVIISAGYTTGGQVEANIANLMAANIKQGATVGGVAGTFTADANAVAGDILTTKTAYVNGVKVTGSMASRGGITQTISTQGGQYTVPAGYHNGSGKVTASFANLEAANVRSGVNIGGVAGSFEGFTKMWTGTVVAQTIKYFKSSNAVGFRPKVVMFYGDGVDIASGYSQVTIYCLVYDKVLYGSSGYYPIEEYIEYPDGSGSWRAFDCTGSVNNNGWNDIEVRSYSTSRTLVPGTYPAIAFG